MRQFKSILMRASRVSGGRAPHEFPPLTRVARQEARQGKVSILAARSIMLVLLAAVSLGANAVSDADALVRQGNAAFERKDYAGAVALFTRAEPLANDPGLIAFNKAAALYQLANYREAERHYRCALENSSEPRRTNARYGLANCLVQQGQGLGAAALQEAIELYELCLRRDDLDPDLGTDARHNLELAKLLWLEARAKQTEHANEEEPNDPTNPKPPDRGGPKPQPGGNDSGTGKPDSKGERTPVKPDAATKPKPSDDQPAPGTGTLPPVPDTAELSPLSPEDAAAHLEDAAARIMRERHAHRLQTVKPSAPGVKDW
jgi:tetratricopeptide (TPR) repeat protein